MDPLSLNALEFSAHHLMSIDQVAAILAQIVAEEPDSELRLERLRKVDSCLVQSPSARWEILPAASAYYAGDLARDLAARFRREPDKPLGELVAQISA